MLVNTTRFGTLEIEPREVLRFPQGLIGLEDCRQWVLLGDAETEALGWLQSLARPEVALPVVSPRRFVPEYQIRLSRRDLLPLELVDPLEAQALVVVGREGDRLTLDLRAPLLFNLERRLGRQAVTRDAQPASHPLVQTASARRSA